MTKRVKAVVGAVGTFLMGMAQVTGTLADWKDDLLGGAKAVASPSPDASNAGVEPPNPVPALPNAPVDGHDAERVGTTTMEVLSRPRSTTSSPRSATLGGTGRATAQAPNTSTSRVDGQQGVQVGHTVTTTPQTLTSREPSTADPADSPAASSQSPEARPKAEFLTPNEGDVIGRPADVRVFASTIPEDHDLWVASQPVDGGEYQPDQILVPEGDNRHVGKVWAGDEPPANSGDRFNVLVIMTTKAVSHQFTAYLDDARKTGSYKGFRFLPEGSTILARVTVTRK